MPTGTFLPRTQPLGQSAASAAAPKKPLQYGRTAPGTRQNALGDKMRQETSMALEQLLKHGSFATGLEALVAKVAAQQLSFEHMLQGQASQFATPHAAPAASAQTGPYRAAPAPTPAPTAAPAARPGLMRRIGLPLALGGMAAGALGMMGGARTLEEDRKRDALVYSPLQGVA